jgi:hypothetical protein
MEKPDNMVRVPCDINSFFKWWFMFLEPFHNLTRKEIEVITCFVRHRYELSKVIKDNIVLDKVVLGNETKRKVREECGISLPHFHAIISKLRKNKVILEDKINPKFIPYLNESNGMCTLLLWFDLNGTNSK